MADFKLVERSGRLDLAQVKSKWALRGCVVGLSMPLLSLVWDVDVFHLAGRSVSLSQVRHGPSRVYISVRLLTKSEGVLKLLRGPVLLYHAISYVRHAFALPHAPRTPHGTDPVGGHARDALPPSPALHGAHRLLVVPARGNARSACRYGQARDDGIVMFPVLFFIIRIMRHCQL